MTKLIEAKFEITKKKERKVVGISLSMQFSPVVLDSEAELVRKKESGKAKKHAKSLKG